MNYKGWGIAAVVTIIAVSAFARWSHDPDADIEGLVDTMKTCATSIVIERRDGQWTMGAWSDGEYFRMPLAGEDLPPERIRQLDDIVERLRPITGAEGFCLCMSKGE